MMLEPFSMESSFQNHSILQSLIKMGVITHFFLIQILIPHP